MRKNTEEDAVNMFRSTLTAQRMKKKMGYLIHVQPLKMVLKGLPTPKRFVKNITKTSVMRMMKPVRINKFTIYPTNLLRMPQNLAPALITMYQT